MSHFPTPFPYHPVPVQKLTGASGKLYNKVYEKKIVVTLEANSANESIGGVVGTCGRGKYWICHSEWYDAGAENGVAADRLDVRAREPHLDK